ncbi:MAG: hypothetical protein CEN88_235 [Candidatus Berkelbacteria bacterium Licking1014_2]|uniref:Uncharacterized protein n=1 Tax=Candidatus Berkelbacteria bacterium Licking1014_2 TaxID=2017146 RepID=A0A554LVW6_9BACT|nr:MAG: hypothetical protein CEN88_235 [Candidatus Berkelbacteria bacterium Licking1014_2]
MNKIISKLKVKNAKLRKIIYIIIIALAVIVGAAVIFWPRPGQFISSAQQDLADKNSAAATSTIKKGLYFYPHNKELKLLLAQTYFSDKKYQEAINGYQQLVQGETTAETLNAMANAYRDNNDIQSAKQYYRQAIELNPQFVKPYINLATILNSEHEYSQSIELLEAGQKAGAGSEVVRLLAITYQRNQNPQSARLTLQSWLANNPDDKNAQNLLTELN